MTSPSRTQWAVALAFAVTVGGAALYLTRPPVAPVNVASPGGDDPLQTGEITTILQPDAIQAVDHPAFVSVGNAGARDNARVIGVAFGGEAHAFPIAYMSRVEIVNDRVGDANIAVTW